jgi:hypothetical protein
MYSCSMIWAAYVARMVGIEYLVREADHGELSVDGRPIFQRLLRKMRANCTHVARDEVQAALCDDGFSKCRKFLDLSCNHQIVMRDSGSWNYYYCYYYHYTTTISLLLLLLLYYFYSTTTTTTTTTSSSTVLLLLYNYN